MKGGSSNLSQEPVNDVRADLLMSQLGLEHADYTLTFDGEKPYCLGEEFLEIRYKST
jgi:hypothetical protein